MKKFLLITTIFLSLCFVSKAQGTSATFVSQYNSAVDTVDNAETNYLSLPSGRSVTGYFKAGTVVFKATEISGTGGGTATLQVSSNGTDFANVPVDTAYTIIDQTAIQTFAWRLTNIAGKSLRIKVTGSGTMSYKIYGSVFLAN